MIKLIIEIHPHGYSDLKKEIASMKIVNNGTSKDRPHTGNYDITIKSTGTDLDETTVVQVNDHIRSEGIWELVYKALRERGKKQWH